MRPESCGPGDTMDCDVVQEERAIDAPARAVWEALVDPEQRREWWSYLELDPVVGGQLTERWVGRNGEEVLTTGVVTEVVPARLLRMTWADEGWPAQTEVEIALLQSDGATTVRIRHAGWRLLPDGRRLAEEHRAGWRLHLSNLRAQLDR